MTLQHLQDNFLKALPAAANRWFSLRFMKIKLRQSRGTSWAKLSLKKSLRLI